MIFFENVLWWYFLIILLLVASIFAHTFWWYFSTIIQMIFFNDIFWWFSKLFQLDELWNKVPSIIVYKSLWENWWCSFKNHFNLVCWVTGFNKKSHKILWLVKDKQLISENDFMSLFEDRFILIICDFEVSNFWPAWKWSK